MIKRFLITFFVKIVFLYERMYKKTNYEHHESTSYFNFKHNDNIPQIFVHIKNDIGYSFNRYGRKQRFLLIKTIFNVSISIKKEKRTILHVIYFVKYKKCTMRSILSSSIALCVNKNTPSKFYISYTKNRWGMRQCVQYRSCT